MALAIGPSPVSHIRTYYANGAKAFNHPTARPPFPQPYRYRRSPYDPNDEYSTYSKDDFENSKTDEYPGSSYAVNFPDGRIQTTTYTEDHYNGYYPVYPSGPYHSYTNGANAFNRRRFPQIYRNRRSPYDPNGDYSTYSKDDYESSKTDEYPGPSYVTNFPDGRIQTTTYTDGHYNGFYAHVNYEGTPVYPPQPAGG